MMSNDQLTSELSALSLSSLSLATHVLDGCLIRAEAIPKLRADHRGLKMLLGELQQRVASRQLRVCHEQDLVGVGVRVGVG
jgi:hypothetical protein